MIALGEVALSNRRARPSAGLHAGRAQETAVVRAHPTPRSQSFS